MSIFNITKIGHQPRAVFFNHQSDASDLIEMVAAHRVVAESHYHGALELYFYREGNNQPFLQVSKNRVVVETSKSNFEVMTEVQFFDKYSVKH